MIVQRIGVTQLNSIQFSFCRDIRVIDVSENSIESVHGIFLNPVIQLRSFSIANQTRNGGPGPSSWFHQNRLIEEIDVSGMGWTNLGLSIFSNNVELQTIRLNNNQLSNWQLQWFRSNPKLKILDISNNNFAWIPHEAFHPDHQLEFVNLNNNQFFEIGPEFFTFSVRFLTDLHLSGNEISFIDRTLLELSPHLSNLDLANNRCVNRTFRDFYRNREFYLAELSACFAGRILKD
jgi:Leucine-rich repeat (LRR) protein